MESAGIFGPKLSGKTTLAKELSRQYWVKAGRRSLVLDINREEWGKHAWVTDDEERFWGIVWRKPTIGKAKPSLVIVDEAAETIKRDKGLIRLFTRLRHLQHKLIVIGHSGENLLPIMRQQFDTLYLFRQSPDDSERWARSMTQEGFLDAAQLEQYEFLYGERFKPPVKRMLDLRGKNRLATK
jgi:hypothetical protein